MRISWDQFYENVRGCCACSLYGTCTNKVPGQGDAHSPLMLIGEGPGYQEDMQGLAFVGPAGQLLTKMLASISLPRDRVYICNVVKCRPPGNRQPLPEEQDACFQLLRQQTALVKPKVILLLGGTAVNRVLGSQYRITRCRGTWTEKKGVWILPTYHPSALLRDSSKKKEAWIDMQLLRDKLQSLGLYNDLYGYNDSEEGVIHQ